MDIYGRFCVSLTAKTECPLGSASEGGFAAEEEVVARRREEIDHLGALKFRPSNGSLGKSFRLASSHTRRRRGHRGWYPVGVASLAPSPLPNEPADLHRALRGGLQRAPRAPFDCH